MFLFSMKRILLGILFLAHASTSEQGRDLYPAPITYEVTCRRLEQDPLQKEEYRRLCGSGIGN